MTTPATTGGPDASLVAIAAELRLRRISAMPIVDASEALIGIVSTTDILRAGERARAREVMSMPVITVRPEDPLDVAARRLVAGRVHRLVVVDDDVVVGILSVRDLLAEVKDRSVLEPVARVMTSPVETVDVGATAEEALAQLAASNVHGLVVVEGAAPIGVFTHAEALAVRRLPRELRARPVEDVMSSETICVDVATPIRRAAAHAASMNVRRLLVTQQRRLVGIASAIDLVDVLCRACVEPAAEGDVELGRGGGTHGAGAPEETRAS